MADAMRGVRAVSASRLRMMWAASVRLWPVTVSIGLAFLVCRVGVAVLVAVSSALVVSLLAYRFREGAILALLISIVVPQLVQMIGVLPDNWDALGGGVRIPDLILVGMWGASTALLLNRTERSRPERAFIAVSLGLAGVLAIAVARNWGSYGLSALGEFRFRYLILGLPVFAALGLDSPKSRVVLARWLAWTPVIGVTLMLPAVGVVRGWTLGEASRFYPSAISLALLLAAIWIGLSKRVTDDGVPPGLAYGALALITLVILKDAHRSVWLVAGVSAALLVSLRVINVRRLLALLVLLLIGGAVLIALTPSGHEVLDYVIARGRAFIDPASDPTSKWRLMVWKAYLGSLSDSLIFGQGFGGYWEVYVPELGRRVSISPHSMYVQTLVKTGLLGLLALGAWFAAAFRALWLNRAQTKYPMKPSQMMLTLGVVAVVAALAYGTVYALDFWTLAWMGLGLAEAFRGGIKVT